MTEKGQALHVRIDEKGHGCSRQQFYADGFELQYGCNKDHQTDRNGNFRLARRNLAPHHRPVRESRLLLVIFQIRQIIKRHGSTARAGNRNRNPQQIPERRQSTRRQECTRIGKGQSKHHMMDRYIIRMCTKLTQVRAHPISYQPAF